LEKRKEEKKKEKKKREKEKRKRDLRYLQDKLRKCQKVILLRNVGVPKTPQCSSGC